MKEPPANMNEMRVIVGTYINHPGRYFADIVRGPFCGVGGGDTEKEAVRNAIQNLRTKPLIRLEYWQNDCE